MVPNVMHECTLVSYNGAIHASMAIACKGKNNPFIEDPDAFVGAFVEELKELAKFYEVDLPITI